jgi:hypothetical protein
MHGGTAEEGAAPLSVAQHMLTRRHSEARSVSAAPWRVARLWHVRRRAEWHRTLELGLPGQARAGLLPHFLPHLPAVWQLLSLPLSILPPKTTQIEGFLRGFRLPQVS